MSRNISKAFLDDLTKGKLSEVLKIIKQDDTLMLELRGNRIITYYRGGKLLEIEEVAPSIYSFNAGDKNYLTGNSVPSLKSIMDRGQCNIELLETYIAKFKYYIDKYFGGIRNGSTRRNRFSIENEIRQHLVRENNHTKKADQTDYFIIDTEYETHNKKKFDIVALEWIANASKRKQQGGYKPQLVVFELKYAEAAISNKCGIRDHLKDFEDFVADEIRVKNFKEEMLKVLEQKRELGLIPYLSFRNKNKVSDVVKDIEFVNIIANYKNESTLLLKEITAISQFKIMTSNFMGYGLYKRNIINKEQAIELLKCE